MEIQKGIAAMNQSVSTKAVEAKHEAVCPSCGTRIYEGELILHDDDVNGWVHARKCGSEPELGETKNPLCTSCWVYHAGECD